jgi:hypothetical protein
MRAKQGIMAVCVAAAGIAAPVLAQTQPIEACVNAKPSTVTVTYGSGTSAAPVTERILRIIPAYCMSFDYGGEPLWTWLSGAGGLSCRDNKLYADHNTASIAFNGYHGSDPPAACGPPVACPSGPPPEPVGSVTISYGKTGKLAKVSLYAVRPKCFAVDYDGQPLWFPKAALRYACEIRGAPVVASYESRLNDYSKDGPASCR